MPAPDIKPAVFLSFHAADKARADQLTGIVSPMAAVTGTAAGLKPGQASTDNLREALTTAKVLIVLLGPKTRYSRCVDYEIQHATASRAGDTAPVQPQTAQSSIHAAWGVEPGAGLIGVILPEHPDATKPYYDPENIPVRLHDLVQQEYAIVKKWSEDPAVIESWLREAEQRRRFRQPERSPALVDALSSFAWDESLDAEKAAILRHDPLAR